MSTNLPSTAWQQHAENQERCAIAAAQKPSRSGSSCPLMAICVVQTALSLTLVWSNTAYIDEADYLWIGHLEIMHWLHGTSWPSAIRARGSFLDRLLFIHRLALWLTTSAASPGRGFCRCSSCSLRQSCCTLRRRNWSDMEALSLHLLSGR